MTMRHHQEWNNHKLTKLTTILLDRGTRTTKRHSRYPHYRCTNVTDESDEHVMTVMCYTSKTKQKLLQAFTPSVNIFRTRYIAHALCMNYLALPSFLWCHQVREHVMVFSCSLEMHAKYIFLLYSNTTVH